MTPYIAPPSAPQSPPQFPPEQRVVMRGLGWSQYQSLRAVRGEHNRRPRLAYLDGAVELMTVSRDHERIKVRIGQALTFHCVDTHVLVGGYGEWTLDSELASAGIEPDECYIFGRGHVRKDRPDLAIEVVWSHGGLDKLEIYRRLEVPEVWFWNDDRLTVHVLEATGYQVHPRSTFVPALDLDLVCRLAKLETVNDLVSALRAARAEAS